MGLLFVVTPVAGCLEPIGEATKEAIGDQPSQSNDSATPPESTEEPSRDTTKELPSTYESALASVEPENDEVRRVSLDMQVEPLTDEGSRMDMHMLVDADERLLAASIAGESADGDRSMVDQNQTLLLGAVAKTTFFGVPPNLFGTYDENSTFADSWGNLSDSAEASSQSGSSANVSDPTAFLEDIDELPENANVTETPTTWQGQPATELTIDASNETADFEGRMITPEDGEHPVLLEMTVQADHSERFTEPTKVTIRFAYGEEASHPHEDALLRLETTTISRESSLFGLADNATRNWTVEPSTNPGTIPLERVEVHLLSSNGTSPLAGAETVVTLPAEQARMTTPNATLVYDDADGDGAVSPGDMIRFTPKTEAAADGSLALYDEQTEVRAMPAPGVAALAAVLAGAGALLRRR